MMPVSRDNPTGETGSDVYKSAIIKSYVEAEGDRSYPALCPVTITLC